VRSALLEGGRWWAEAFERAGFIDAFRVELLPEGAHPLDVRYNMVQWVHRSTRGWSYGHSVCDPRTGEIIKGHVSLGSLRVRQDILLFEGLAGTTQTGTGRSGDPVQLALARIRQLSAHEIGHTLGFAHNFAASTYGGRASVMDYPAPLIRAREDGTLDFSEAYAVGIGEWDMHTVRYAYSQFLPDADERAELEGIVRDGLSRGLRFFSDADARPLGSAHPLAHLWDNGDDPVKALTETMRVRRIALGRFGEENIGKGRPLALLEERLAPLYLHHRYQLEAAIKVVGGVDYSYAVRGDGQGPAKPIGGDRQRGALRVVLAAMAPRELDLPERILGLVEPRPFGYSVHRELFEGSTGLVFDPLGAAETGARLVVEGLLHPERCARLVDFHRRDQALPGLEEVVSAVVESAFEPAIESDPRLGEIRRAVQQVVVVGLIDLARMPEAPASVRSRVEFTLHNLSGLCRSKGMHFQRLAEMIDRYLNRKLDAPFSPARAKTPPPGSPIGLGLAWGDEGDWCGWR